MAFTIYTSTNILFTTTYIFFKKIWAFSICLFSFWALKRIEFRVPLMTIRVCSSLYLQTHPASIHYPVQSHFPIIRYLLQKQPHFLIPIFFLSPFEIYHKIPQTEWLTNNRYLFLAVPEARQVQDQGTSMVIFQ